MDDQGEKLGYRYSRELKEMRDFTIRVICTKPGCNFAFTESVSDESLGNAKRNSLGTGRIFHSQHKEWLVAKQIKK